jgi:hypothetical protein
MVPVVSSLVTGILALNVPASRRQWRRRAGEVSGDSAAEPPPRDVTAVQIKIDGLE